MSIRPKTNVFGLEGYYDDGEIVLTWIGQNYLRVDYLGRLTDIRNIKLNARGVRVVVYANSEELTLEKLQKIEKLIIDEQASYGVSLPQGQNWIDVHY